MEDGNQHSGVVNGYKSVHIREQYDLRITRVTDFEIGCISDLCVISYIGF